MENSFAVSYYMMAAGRLATNKRLMALVIHPNPVNDILNFSWVNQYNGDALLTVIDIAGKEVKNIRIDKTAQLYNVRSRLIAGIVYSC